MLHTPVPVMEAVVFDLQWNSSTYNIFHAFTSFSPFFRDRSNWSLSSFDASRCDSCKFEFSFPPQGRSFMIFHLRITHGGP